jgi:prepilin-type N-terminal cleavage/methylation domain-containing protein
MRRGMTIVEVIVAIAVLTAAMVTLVQLIGLVARQRRVNEQRLVALEEVANQAERLAIAAWEEVAPDKLRSWEPSPELTAALPKAVCRAVVTEDAGPPICRSIQLEVAWTNAVGQKVEPARLTIWRYRTEAQP